MRAEILVEGLEVFFIIRKKNISKKFFLQTRKKKFVISTKISIILIVTGAMLIAPAIHKQAELKKRYSADHKLNVVLELQKERKTLEEKKTELEQKGFTFTDFTTYKQGEESLLKVLTEVLDEDFNYWEFYQYKNNNYTARYCYLLKENYTINNIDIKRAEQSKITPLFVFGFMSVSIAILLQVYSYLMSERKLVIKLVKRPELNLANDNTVNVEQEAVKIAKIS